MGDRVCKITSIVLHGFSKDNKRAEIVFDTNGNIYISGSSMGIHSSQDGNRRVTIDSRFHSMNMTVSESAILNPNENTSVWKSDELDTFLENFVVNPE